MKHILLVALIALAGCDVSQYSEEIKGDPLPPGMEGCRHFFIGQHNGGGQSVWRCPNSTTTSSQGKGPPVTVTE